MKYKLTSVIRPAHLMFIVLAFLNAAIGLVSSNRAFAESGIAPSQQSVSSPQEFEGKCRGFREGQTVGILTAPAVEIEKLVEGEGSVLCKLVPGSASAIRIINGCPEENPCEVDGRFIAHGQDVDVLSLTTIRSWDGWRSTCYGAVSSLGDGIFSVGVTDGETSSGLKRTVRCDFFSDSVAKRILAECPEGSICEVRGRFERQPVIDILSKDSPTAIIGYVDSVKRNDSPVKAAATMGSPRVTSDGSAAPALCSKAAADPLFPMILDNLVSGGQHIAPNWTSSTKDNLTSAYGAFLRINDDVTVERIDQRTGKTGCAVTYQANLQGLAGQLLMEGSTKRVQVLLRRITREGRIITRRQVYTVQRSPSGSLIASFGLTTQDMAAARRPRHICLFAFSGGCLAWSR